jgi:hypothetical protein
MRPGQTQFTAQKIDKQEARLDASADCLAVDGQFDGLRSFAHGSLGTRANALLNARWTRPGRTCRRYCALA